MPSGFNWISCFCWIFLFLKHLYLLCSYEFFFMGTIRLKLYKKSEQPKNKLRLECSKVKNKIKSFPPKTLINYWGFKSLSF